MDKCEFCLKHDEGACAGIFDFKLTCCRVRWVLGCPNTEIAKAWLEHWKTSRNIGHDAVEETRKQANKIKKALKNED